MVSFGVSLVGLTYMISFMFKKSETAFRQVALFFIFVGYYVPTLFSQIAGAASGGGFGSQNFTVNLALCIDPFFAMYQNMLQIVFQ